MHTCEWIGKICSRAFRGLYNVRQIRKFLTVQSTKTLIHAFVSTHLDYYNALLFYLPKYQLDRLQKVHNAAARVTFQIVKFDHITPALIDLHLIGNTPSKSRTEKLVFLDVIGDDVRRDCALNGVKSIQLCLRLWKIAKDLHLHGSLWRITDSIFYTSFFLWKVSQVISHYVGYESFRAMILQSFRWPAAIFFLENVVWP